MRIRFYINIKNQLMWDHNGSRYSQESAYIKYIMNILQTHTRSVIIANMIRLGTKSTFPHKVIS